MRSWSWSSFALASLAPLALLALACTKSEPAPPAADTKETASAAPTASSPPEATTAAAASASASAEPAAQAQDAAAPGSGAGAKVAAAAPKEAASGAAPASADCGTKPLPDCPLQAWMKANMSPPSLAGDTAALSVALEKSAAFAPAGYGNWASIAKDGAKAAKAGDLPAAKASCRSCHDQYKKKYQAEMRGRKI